MFQTKYILLSFLRRMNEYPSIDEHTSLCKLTLFQIALKAQSIQSASYILYISNVCQYVSAIKESSPFITLILIQNCDKILIE